ncbi:MAG: sugar lactone lactonase YvrE [Candidatus Nitrosomirales archaeon]|jgi:sugar lactone lactonase YvrE
MKVLSAAIVLTVLLASIYTTQSFAVYNNRNSMTIDLDDNVYMQGETVSVSGTVTPFRDKVPTKIEVLDPTGKLFLAEEVLPEPNDDNIGLFSYEFKLSKDASPGIWVVGARYASQYMVYDQELTPFRVADRISILASPFLQVNVDGAIDSNSGEWAHKYDSKHWKPFQNNPTDIEGNIAFNAYYSNGILYGIFDVPDKKFDAKDFVEIGIDKNNVGDQFKSGDEVYIFRVFRDGTYTSFRLGTELAGDRMEKHQFRASAEEGGDIRVQIFDQEGKVVNVLDSLRDKASTSYKGMLGIAGLEIDAEGNIYVLDSDSGTISKFSADGRLLGSFGSLGTEFKEFIDPTGIALGSDGSIFVADTGNARVQKFDRYGKFLGSFGSMGLLSVGMADAGFQNQEENKRHDLFESPESIIVGPSGDVYVADRRTGTVNMFDNDGDYIKSFGAMVYPRGIAADSQGNIYAVEQGNNRVVKFDSGGNQLKVWGTFGIEDGMFKAPYGIAIDSNDNVYVADSVNNRIQKFDPNGNFISKFGVRGSGPGQLISPHGLAIDSLDNLYVIDTGNYRVQKFSSDGKFVYEFGSKGSGTSNFMSAEGITLDSQGNVYVTDIYNKKVQKFDREGTFLAEWGSEGAGSGEFGAPFGIAVDASDGLYITDPFNKRVQKFDANGNFLLRWGSDVKEAPAVQDIPKGEHYIVFDTDSHSPIGIIDAKLVEENGKGAYIVESGHIWKILHIFKDQIYVKMVEYAKNAILSWTPDGIDVDQYGNVYIVDRENEIAKKFDPNGMLISKWGSSGTGDGQFTKPTAMDLDSENNVYIVDTGNNRIQKFDSEGNFLAKWGTAGYGPSQFKNARGIAIDAQDNVYVLDNDNSRVQKFDKYGNYVTEWGSKGSSLGQFDNLSTEGIAVDTQGRVYVADLPGETKATHWVAEVAIPLFTKSEAFSMFIAEGTFGDHPSESKNPNSVRIFDVYRNAWPAGAISVLPETWAKATLIDIEEAKLKLTIRIDNVKACTNEVCNELNESSKPVLTGTNVIVSASVGVQQANDEFEYDRTKVALQYSFDGQEWTDADSKFTLVSKQEPATVNLKWTPLDSGEAKLRVTSTGMLTEQTTTDPVGLSVQESESLRIRADLKWSPSKVMQDEPVSFELAFTAADENMLSNLNYDFRVIKDNKEVAELPLLNTENGNAVYQYTFKQAGLHTVQVSMIGIGSADNFIPMKKVFNYKVDVVPNDKPIQVTTVQKGEAMKVMIKNRDISNLRLNLIDLSLDNIDKVDYKLPVSWTSSVDTETKTIQFSTEDDPLSAGESMEFVIRSKAFTKSLHSVCWDLEQSTLTVKLC